MTDLTKNTTTFTLNDGNKIPAIGFGTWQARSGDAERAVGEALKAGYRHIDTAAIYGNETEVGNAIKASGIPRKEIFVTTKLWNDRHKDAAVALDESLKRLQLDYVDLYLIHWPWSKDKLGEVLNDWDYVDTYLELQKLQKAGKIKSIGVSNFSKSKLERLLSSPGVNVVPATNQIEAHPFLTQPELFEYSKLKNIRIEAYSPLGQGQANLFTNVLILEIAKKNKVDVGQVLISWAVQRGTVVLPKSTTSERIISNLETFTLSDEDFQAINKLEASEGTKRVVVPDGFSFLN